MAAIKVNQVKRVDALEFKEESIWGSILPVSPFTSASVGYVLPNSEQTKHFHKRPNDGVEIIFVYQGKFKLLTVEGESENWDTQDGPVFIQVDSRCVASLKNIGDEEVRFFSVFAPGFEIDELTFIE